MTTVRARYRTAVVQDFSASTEKCLYKAGIRPTNTAVLPRLIGWGCFALTDKQKTLI